jgi:hypothetical protein
MFGKTKAYSGFAVDDLQKGLCQRTEVVRYG